MNKTVVGQNREPHISLPTGTGANSLFAAMRHRNFQLYFG